MKKPECTRLNAMAFIVIAVALVVIIALLAPSTKQDFGEDAEMVKEQQTLSATGVPEPVEFIGALYELARRHLFKNITQPFKKLEEEHAACYSAYKEHIDGVLEKIDPSVKELIVEALKKVVTLKANERYGEKEKQMKEWKDAMIHFLRRYQQLSDQAKQSIRDAFPSLMRAARNRFVRDALVFSLQLGDEQPPLFPEISVRERLAIQTRFNGLNREGALLQAVLSSLLMPEGISAEYADPMSEQAKKIYRESSTETKKYFAKIAVAVATSGKMGKARNATESDIAKAVVEMIRSLNNDYEALSAEAKKEIEGNFPHLTAIWNDSAFRELIELAMGLANVFDGLMQGHSEPAWCTCLTSH